MTHQIGASLLVVWKDGTTPDSGLNPGQQVTVIALYNITSGKQIGKTMTGNGASENTGFGGIDPTSPFTAQTGDGKVLYADGTDMQIATPSQAAAEKITGPGSDGFRSALQILPVSKTSAIYAWENGKTIYYQLGKSGLLATVGPKRTCDDPTGSALVGSGVVSSSGDWVDLGRNIVNSSTGAVRCLASLSTEPIEVKAISDTGDVWGAANSRQFVLKSGTSKPTIMPTGTTLPVAALPDYLVFALNLSGAGGGVLVHAAK